ncbi:hypothetical protein GCM10007387_57580 [Pseudoduganella albidiflava]|uniref:Uncharacterized protein n=1 Tax=Pseudoduganella albidiflava TaxID=321983 RepID=A0AA87Y380_9BURK|nr:hypothetical protein GCM10007387_57580 [Pseudoduganella albidiflava]
MQLARPDQLSLEHAHRALRSEMSLEAMLSNPALKVILENRARAFMQRRARVDVKKLQANDNDE